MPYRHIRRAAFGLAGLAVAFLATGLWPPLAWRLVKILVGGGEALLVIASALGWGSLLWRNNFEEKIPGPWRLLAGIAFLSLSVFFLSSVGAFRVSAAVLLLGAGIIRTPWGEVLPLIRPRGGAVGVTVLLALAPMIVSPVVYWDSCSYHLAIPEYLLARGELPASLSYVYGFYPPGMECLYALILWMPMGETGAQSLNLAIFLAAIASVAPRSSVGRRRVWEIALSIPGLVLLMGLPKNSALLALSGAVAFEAICDTASSPTATVRRRRDLAVGLGIGMSLFTHYGGLWTAVVLLPAHFLVRGFRATRIASISMLACAIPLWSRNLIVTGNPLYPYLSFLFGGSEMRLASIGVDEGAFTWVIFRDRALLPWTSLEGLGDGSTLGLLLPVCLALAWTKRAQPGVRMRFIAGLLILAAGTLIHARPRYGIAGLFILLPLAAEGLILSGRILRPALFVQVAVALLLIVDGFFQPLGPVGGQADGAYRTRFDPAYPVAIFAAERLPEDSKIATVGILRPYHWQGRLELVSEDHEPALAGIFAHADDANGVIASLKRHGFTHLALDRSEWKRLRREYGHLALTPEQDVIFNEVLRRSSLLAGNEGVELYFLPAPD